MWRLNPKRQRDHSNSISWNILGGLDAEWAGDVPLIYSYLRQFDGVFLAGYLHLPAGQRKDPRHYPTSRCVPSPPIN